MIVILRVGNIRNKTNNSDHDLGVTWEYANYPIVLEMKWNVIDKESIFYFKYVTRKNVNKK